MVKLKYNKYNIIERILKVMSEEWSATAFA